MATQTLGAFIDMEGNQQWGVGISNAYKIQEGTYLIEFAQPFRKQPIVTVTIFGSPWQTYELSTSVVDISPYHCVYQTSGPKEPKDSGAMVTILGE